MAGGIRRTRLTGNLTDSRVSHWLKPTGVKSVQKFTIDTSVILTATLTTAVDTGNSYVVFLGSVSSQNTAVNRDLGRLVLTNSTTVTATISSAQSVISGMVIECWPGLIKSLQVSTITISTAVTTGTATINAVTVAKTLLLWMGTSGNIGDATTHDQATSDMSLTNATTVTMTLGAGAGGGGGLTMVGGFTVVEFY
jgi:hypothetical protein